MRQYSKLTFAVLLVTVLMLASVACGSTGPEDSGAPVNSTSTPSVTSTPASVATGGSPSSDPIETELIVDSVDFTPDVNPGDGRCADVRGMCTLLSAVQEANATPGHDRIRVSAGTYFLGSSSISERPLGLNTPITGPAASPLLVISDQVTIIGEADETILDGQRHAGIIHVLPSATVHLEGLVVRNGLSFGQGAGGIWNEGDLTLDRIVVTASEGVSAGGVFNDTGATMLMKNSTVSDTAGAASGGIRNYGDLEIRDSLVLDNGDPERCSGGGIDNKVGGTVFVYSSEIRGNSARVGGGILNDGGSMTIVDSMITENQAPVWGGGGILNDADGTLEISNSSLIGNTAATGAALTNRGTTVAENIRVIENHATEGGGGFGNFIGSTTVRNSEIRNNTAAGGAGAILTGVLFVVEDSVIEANEAGEYGGVVAGNGLTRFVRTQILDNRAGREGGAIHVWEGRVELLDSIVRGNSALHGGAVQLAKGEVQAQATEFRNNSAPACESGTISWIGPSDSDDPTCG